MKLTGLQQQVYNLALFKLQLEPWFRGVCMNYFPTDEDIERDGVNTCADRVYWETHYWDGDKGNA